MKDSFVDRTQARPVDHGPSGQTRSLSGVLVLLLFVIHLPWILGRNWGLDLSFLEVWDEEGRMQGALAQGAVLALLVILSLARIAHERAKLRLSRLEKVLLLYVSYGIISALYGLLQGNSLLYLAGDLYQLSTFAVGFFLCRQWLEPRMLSAFSFWVLLSMSVPIVIDMSAVLFTGDILMARYGLGKHLVVLLFLLPQIIDVRRPSLTHIALMALAMANLALTLSKGLVFLVPLMIVSYVLFLAKSSLLRLNVRLTLGLLAGGMVLTLVASEGVSYQGLQLIEAWRFRVESFWAEKYDYYSISGRTEEAKTAVEDVLASNLLLGKGLGASYVLDVANSLKIEKHYVHLLFSAVLLRQGLLGIGLFVWLLWLLVTLGVRRIRDMAPGQHTTIAAGAFMVLLGHMVIAMYASGVFFSNGLLLGMLSASVFVAPMSEANLKRAGQSRAVGRRSTLVHTADL